MLFIVIDDMGFGHLGCYGSPIATPSIDAIAKDGRKFFGETPTSTRQRARAMHAVD